MDPGVIGDGLVLDLLDRMPTPHALRLGIGAGERRWIGEDGVGQRRGEMLPRAGRGGLHQRPSFPGPGDGESGATPAGWEGIIGTASLAGEAEREGGGGGKGG